MYLFCIENIKKKQLFHFEISRLMSQQYTGWWPVGYVLKWWQRCIIFPAALAVHVSMCIIFLYKQTIDFSFLYKNCTMSHFCYYVYRVMCQAEAVKSSCGGRQQDTAQENSWPTDTGQSPLSQSDHGQWNETIVVSLIGQSVEWDSCGQSDWTVSGVRQVWSVSGIKQVS